MARGYTRIGLYTRKQVTSIKSHKRLTSVNIDNIDARCVCVIVCNILGTRFRTPFVSTLFSPSILSKCGSVRFFFRTDGGRSMALGKRWTPRVSGLKINSANVLYILEKKKAFRIMYILF